MVAGEGITLGEWLRRWGRLYYGADSRRSESVLGALDVLTRTHLGEAVDLPLSGLEDYDWRGWVDGLLDRLAPGTVNRYLALLRLGVEAARKQGLTRANPLVLVRPARRPEASWAIIDPDDIPRFVERCFLGQPTRGLHFALMAAVAITTGARLGELSGLRWPDVDLHARRMRIARQYHRGYREPKTPAAIRTVGIGRVTVRAFELQRERNTRTRARMNPRRRVDADPDVVFPTLRGTPIYNRGTVQAHLDKLTQSIGLPRVRFHDLRHSFATAQIAAGADLTELSGVLGHASYNTTVTVYGHLTNRGLDEVAARMDRIAGEH